MTPTVSLTTDIALFTLREGVLHLLLIERGIAPFKGKWALPGGFVVDGESLEACARRELAEEAGVEDVYLEQLYTFGAPGRDPRGRVVTVAYVGLVPSDELKPVGGSDASRAAWHSADALPPLAFDHAEIVALARQRLTAKLDYTTIAFQFLPTTFTLSEAQAVYEAVGGAELDKRNFRKAILATGHLAETGEKRGGVGRPASLYRLTDPSTVHITK